MTFSSADLILSAELDHPRRPDLARIRDLYLYPVKSLRGLRVTELVLERDGPRLDRRWMLVDGRGTFLSQRTHPGLARIAVTLGRGVTLTHDEASIEFGVEDRVGPEIEVTVHGQAMLGREVDPAVSAWFTRILGHPARLVSWVEGQHREFAPGVTDYGVRFVDQKPLLVISVASLADLNARVGRTLEMIRFRPNVVVEETRAYEEDTWTDIEIEGQSFRRLKACTRCRITMVDPLTGEVADQEPLRTLMGYRRTPKGVAFGSYFGHFGTGTLRTGAELFSRSTASV